MPKLKTWSRGRPFEYERDTAGDVTIRFGAGQQAKISATQLRSLAAAFGGQQVVLGTSRDNAPVGSLGEWLQSHVTRTAIASYVGPILVNEGLAQRDKPTAKALVLLIF